MSYATHDRYGNPRGWAREVEAQRRQAPALRQHPCTYCGAPATSKVGGKWQCQKHLWEGR